MLSATPLLPVLRVGAIRHACVMPDAAACHCRLLLLATGASHNSEDFDKMRKPYPLTGAKKQRTIYNTAGAR